MRKENLNQFYEVVDKKLNQDINELFEIYQKAERRGKVCGCKNCLLESQRAQEDLYEEYNRTKEGWHRDEEEDWGADKAIEEHLKEVYGPEDDWEHLLGS